MQKNYKKAMEEIRLSDSDRARILANVKKAYEDSSGNEVSGDKVVSMQGRPYFSTRRKGIVAAAAVVVLLVGTLVARGQFFGTSNPNDIKEPVVVEEPEEEIWIELDSIDDIATETDCKTYTLSNVSKSYKVKKVQVAKEQKHVKITYKSEKYKDKILLEYKEEENAPDVTEQFSEQNELKTEKVGDKEVTMYGNKDCDAMTWQQESCTFAVTMSKSCSTDKAAKLASGTKEKGQEKPEKKEEKPEPEKTISRNAVGWGGGEQQSSDKQRRKVLKKVFELYGFRVTIQEPAKNVAYKLVENFESFSFTYPEVEELKGKRVVGYAGRDGSPPGVLDEFDEGESIFVNGIPVQIYVNDDGEEIYTFTKKDINFTILVGEISVEDKEILLSGLMSVIHISLESGETDEEEEEPEETPGQETPEDDKVEKYREAVQNIQYAIADASLKKLSTYIEFPLTIKGLDITVASAKEFLSLDSATIFQSEWVDSVAAYDTGKIKANMKTITMGSGSNSLVCKFKNGTALITELSIEGAPEEPTPSPTANESGK